MMAIQQGMESILEDIEHEQEEEERKHGRATHPPEQPKPELEDDDMEGWGDDDLKQVEDKDELKNKKDNNIPYVSANKRLSVIDKYHQKHADKQKSLVAAEAKKRKQWTKGSDKKSSK